MKNITESKKGLSNVVTTLIILCVAVLLAGVLAYYATNVMMIRTEQEEVRVRKPHIWVQEGDNAYAALMVQNLGGRDVLIDKITVRGVNCPWGGLEVIATGDGSTLSFPFTPPASLDNAPLVPDSLTITATVGGLPVTITDTVAIYPAGTLADAAATVSGAIDYETGIWTLLFIGTPPDVGSPITAEYYYGVDMTQVYYYLVQPGEDISGDFELSIDALENVFAQIGSVPADLAGWDMPSTDIPLKSSGTMLFYITNPVNIGLQDVGTTVSITIFTSNAQWIQETNVEAAVIE